MATVSKEKEVAVTKSAAVALSAMTTRALELEAMEQDYEDMSLFEIPMLKLMQGQSDFVKEGNANIGEWRSSIDADLLSKRGEPLELIFLTKKTYWSEYFLKEGDEFKNKKWIRNLDYTAETALLPIREGETVRVKVVDWYVLPATRDEQEIYSKIPFLFRFQISYLPVAKNLNTRLNKLKKLGHSRVDHVWNVTSKVNSKDANKNLIPVIEFGRETTVAEKECATMWLNDLLSGAVKTNVSEGDGEETGNANQDIPF